MAMLSWNVSVNSTGHLHSLALAAEAEKAETKDGSKRATVHQIEDYRITFLLETLGQVTARHVAEWVTANIIKPTNNQFNTLECTPTVKVVK